MAVQSYVITRKTGSYSRKELRDGTPFKYALRDPAFKDKNISDEGDYVLYSYRGKNVITLDDSDAKKLQKQLGLVMYIPGKRTLDPDSVKVPKGFDKLPIGNILALAALISGTPIEKLTRSKATDILAPLVKSDEDEVEAA